ncbi:MFS transporter [Verrucomicrobiota bacterium]
MKSFFSGLFRTQEALSGQDIVRAERILTVDSVCATGMGALAGGPFLAAFALAIGASNYEVGMLATIALLSQLMQIPGLFITNFFRKRRAITAILAGASRLLWVFIILIPVLFVNRGVTFLLQWFLIAALVGAAAGPAWNSLLRDIVPKQNMGRVFAHRMRLGIGVAMVLTLGGGRFVDWWQSHSPDTVLYAYSCLFAVGVVLGVCGAFAVGRLPEPAMKTDHKQSVFELMKEPVRDSNFRKLLVFAAFWSFAVNMAGPFFIIYMLRRIEISLSMVTLLTVTSQLSNVLFLKIWGRMADRFSSKSVFAVSGPMFFISVLAWSFTTMPDRYFLTIPLLFAIHILSGCALAGVNLCSSSIALKLSPADKAHGYMTVFGLVAALAGACGPFIGGILADFFANRELGLSLSWSDPVRQLSVYAINLKALDFVFLTAFFVGLFAMHKLALVKEEGEIPEGKVVTELIDQVVLPFKMVSSVEGLMNRVSHPVSMIIQQKNRVRSRKGNHW